MEQSSHEILGIRPNATERDVRRAYRALLFELEDKGQSDAEYPVKKERLERAFAECLARAQELKPTDSAIEPAPLVATDPKSKLLLRLALGLLGLAALIFGFQWFRSATEDPTGASPLDSVGMIAALEHEGVGSQVVVFKPDGTKVPSPDYREGIQDRDVVWRPDGNRLLFVSDRDGSNFNVFRWKPGEDSVEVRSSGRRARSAITYGPEGWPDLMNSALVVSGGLVYEYNQRTGQSVQVLPPAGGRTQGNLDEGSGSVSQLEGLYGQIGQAFLRAMWGENRKLLWATMRRETDEVFVINPLTREINDGRPRAVLAGKSLDFDVAANGTAVLALSDYQFLDPANVPPELLKDGKPVPPFESAILVYGPDGNSPPFVLCHSIGNQMRLGPPGANGPLGFEEKKGTRFGFAAPKFSPDGQFVVFCLTKTEPNGAQRGVAIIVFPLTEAAGSPPRMRVAGDVADPSWSPDGRSIVFTVRGPEGNRRIAVMDRDEGEPKIIADSGDFSQPLISPQLSGGSAQ
jgi:hypothetical protein